MIIGIILAGGSGSRMDDSAIPKQFMMLKDKPVIVHTVGKFLVNEDFDRIVLTCPKLWLESAKSLFKEYLPGNNIHIIAGGESRNDTIMKAISYIGGFCDLKRVTLVTHDGARPLLSGETINRNIETAKRGVACSTVISVIDTIYESRDGRILGNIPKREYCYQVQTPQCFNAREFKRCYEKLSDSERKEMTDAIGVLHHFGIDIELVKGNHRNIKLTYPLDFKIAEALMETGE